MRFALVQMEVVPGAVEKNFRSMLSMIAASRERNADLVIFPELCLSGYLLTDMWVNESFCKNLMYYNTLLLEASREIAIAYGNVFVEDTVNKRWNDNAIHPNKDGRSRKYNAVYLIQHGAYAPRVNPSTVLPDGIQPKTLLPNYRIFDDERYFFSFQDVGKDAGVPLEKLAQPFIIQTSTGPKKIGFEICEDLWCQDYRVRGKPLNLTNILIENGAEVIVNISASPWNHEKNSSRDNRIRFLKQEAGEAFVPFIYVNRTGVENNGKNIVTFDGGTTVYNSDGNPVRLAENSYKQELIVFDETEFQRNAVQRKKEDPIKQKFEAIVQGINHLKLFIQNDHALQFVIGLSGGIDSAVVASLLVAACGRESVLAVNMPSRYNRELTKDSAKEIAANLGIDYIVVPIDGLNNTNLAIFESLDKKYPASLSAKELSDENIQAKIRGTNILSNIAGRYGRFFTNNGNKLEVALGYATLYGDINGAIAPIGDLTKTEVYQMAQFINTEVFKRRVIPDRLFPDALFRYESGKVMPSPELKKDQVNPMRFGYHCALLNVLTDYLRVSPEDILEWYLNATLHSKLNVSVELMRRWQMDDSSTFVSDLEWFVSSMQKNIFKRIQSPPIIITSRSAFGYDIRESMVPYEQTVRYKGLREEVLKMQSYPTLSL